MGHGERELDRIYRINFAVLRNLTGQAQTSADRNYVIRPNLAEETVYVGLCASVANTNLCECVANCAKWLSGLQAFVDRFCCLG